MLFLTLHVFAVVFNVKLVKTFLARVVLDTDGAIAVVFYNRFIHITGRHFNFSCTDAETHTVT